MGKAEDPFYQRKPVPTSFIQDVGITGLTTDEEFYNRERKFSVDGADVRRFSHSKTGGWKPESDPYYGRKMVHKQEIGNVGATGLTAEEEYLNRERKYSVNGVDVRKFGSTSSGGFHPTADPYYGRQMVKGAAIQDVGETGLTAAEEYETRERKQSMVQLSSDPFSQFTGAGHRQSISAVGGQTAIAASQRRRSSAAPAHAAAATAGGTHSGFDGAKLGPIQSRPEPVVFNTGNETTGGFNSRPEKEANEITTTTDDRHPHHDHQHYDPDSVAPDEVR